MGPLIFPLDHLSEAAPYLGDETLLGYLGEGQSESFEGFEDFDLLAFDWYDLHSERTETAKLLLYLSREKLIFFCESAAAEACVRAIWTGWTGIWARCGTCRRSSASCARRISRNCPSSRTS